MASKNAHIIENPRSIIVTKVGVAEGFENIKNLEDEAFALSESKASILLRLKDNFDRIENWRISTESRIGEFRPKRANC